MPRAFTIKEREYMARLAARNTTEDNQTPKDGLETPMPSKERVRRKRIREKANTTMRDLLVAQTAGIIDFGEVHKSHTVGMAIGQAEVDDGEDAFWMYIGSPPEEVDLSK